jgi:UDP-glucose 4-epimerase
LLSLGYEVHGLVRRVALEDPQRRFTRACEKWCAPRSAAIFGELKHLPIRENHPCGPDTPYGVSKLPEEKHCLAYAKLYGRESVCLRYFNVYGLNQRYDAYGNIIPIFAHRMVHGETLTIYDDGEQTGDFVNVCAVARANVLAAQTRGLSGAFNSHRERR